MATKKIRVYELARELGVDNHLVVDLANELKIGVKSHSSSIDEPSADRVRRLADSRGLKQVAAPEPEPAPVPEPEPAPVPEPPPVALTPAAPEPVPAPIEESKPAVVRSAHRVVRSTAPPPVRPEPEFRAPDARPVRPVTDSERPAAAAAGPVTDRPTPAVPGQRTPAPRPISHTGKPVPPPPGQRMPPPPPGRAPTGGGPGGPGGPRGGGGGAPRPGGDRGPRGGGPGGGGGFGGPRGGGGGGGYGAGPGGGGPGGPGGARTGAPGRGRGGPGGPGGPGGGPFGGPGGRGRPGGQRPRKKKKRRRDEELAPSSQRLSPSDTPVPEGEIVVSRGITIQELAPKLNRTAADLVRLLFEAGEMVTATASLADEMIELIAESLGAEVLLVEPGSEQEVELLALLVGDDEEEDDALLEPRPPVITVMGHVDHGKTTLLDTIRSANVVAGEAGGITQHIGAYQVDRHGRRITFVDTPGHEAFTAMRSRGAQVTDIVILVVAADDGVMPQTVEAINHARAAEVPIVVAVTKSDREDADPTRVRQQLTEQQLVPEEWGGDTIVLDVAAPINVGVDELLDALLLVADAEIAEDLVANPKKAAKAYVLESNLDPGRGPVVTALVEEGTLRVGDTMVAGQAWGRVRAMFDEHGRPVGEAGPSVPVTVLGLDDVPLAGDELRVAPTDKIARTVAEARAHRRKIAAQRGGMMLSGGARLEDVFAMVQRGEIATLNLIVKADMQGSLEAITDALRKIDHEHEEVRLSFVHRGVGGITESDVNLAVVSNATVIGFNVRPDRNGRELAEREGVEMRLYEVIYGVLEDVNNALVGMLKPEYEEVVTGDAEVREIFSVPRIGRIAGCFVTSGVIARGSKVRFLRDGTVIWKGAIASLRRFKDDVREVRDGFECGIGLENYQDLKPGDVIETYEDREIARV
ncbi:MAG: translation initiation factor IF-2 [Actinomycetota bacterium]